MSAVFIGALLAGLGALIAAGGVLLWWRVAGRHRRRAAAALFADVQLQLLTQATVAALLDEARRNLTATGQWAP